jgi:16S rRNA processing protein RimM
MKPRSASKAAPAAKNAPKAAPAAKAAPAPAAPKVAPVAPSAGMVAVAEVARPHGVLGELRLKIYNEGSELLATRPRIRLLHADGVERDAAFTSVRESNKALLVRLAGVGDRDAAEALRGARVLVARSDFPPLDEGEFYACDIEGARAVLRSGEEVGRVLGIASYPTCDVIVVGRGDGKRIEVPLIEAYVGAVDAAGGVVELVTIEGLD